MAQDTAVLVPVSHVDEALLNQVNRLSGAGYRVFCACYQRACLSGAMQRLSKMACVMSCSPGTGRTGAIKEGLTALSGWSDVRFILTLEPDGRYGCEAVKRLERALFRRPDTVAVGSYEPFGLKTGQKAAYFAAGLAYRFVSGEKVFDLSTGFMGFSVSLCRQMLSLMKKNSGTFELCAVLTLCLHGVPIQEIALDDIPARAPFVKAEVKTAKKLFFFIKTMLPFVFVSRFALFTMSSLLAFLVDWSVFELLHIEFSKTAMNESVITFIAQITARAISASLNFWINYKFVFKSNESKGASAVKYFSTVVIILCLQAVLMYWLDTILGLSVTYTPLLVQTMTFFINYIIQKKMVYKKKTVQINM